jgi:hypothetical protein
MGVKVDSLIFQLSAEANRGAQEKELMEKGLVPISVFANGPDNAFLIAARLEDLNAAFGASGTLAEGLGAERLAFRMRRFDAISFAIETDMKYMSDPSEFPNDCMFLLVEALHQVGFRAWDEVPPSAVAFERNDLHQPFFEPAPGSEDPPETAEA